MKKNLSISLGRLMIIGITFSACKKTIPDQPSVNAGPDQSIIPATNSINLDGSASTDPDNGITSSIDPLILYCCGQKFQDRHRLISQMHI